MPSISELINAAPWDESRTRALPGQARGDLLGAWGDNLAARHGAAALARVRAALGPHAVPNTVGPKDWVPAYAPPLVTEVIARELCGGDLHAMYPMILDDTRKQIGRLKHLALRAMGPTRAFKIVPAALRQVYDRGAVTVTAGERRVRMELTDHPLFGQPTWRVLQLFATQMVLELAGATGEVTGEPLSDEGFACIARW